MAIPAKAIRWEYEADPSDVVAYVAQFGASPGGDLPPVLEDGETIVSMDAEIEPTSAALGGTILEGVVDGYDRGPFIGDNVNGVVWVTIADEMRADPAFSTDAGAAIGVVFTIKTSLHNTYQLTFYFRAMQK